jgi:hypothetical protein
MEITTTSICPFYLFHYFSMKYFQSTILSSSKRPELVNNEDLIAQQGHIGLYEG